MTTRKFSSSIFLCVLFLILDLKEVNVQRTHSSTIRTTSYGENHLQTRNKAPMYSEELKSTPHYDSRIPSTHKPRCRTTRCNVKNDRRPETSMTTKSASVKYKALKLSALTKNDTKPEKFTKKSAKFSRMLDSTGRNEDSGFVPIQNPRGLKKSPRRARHHKATEELEMKESRTSPTTDILGNGNFEILSGGVYSEEESNEIPEGRRMSRGYDTFASPRHQYRIPFNERTFQFPAFYQNRHPFPAHPMFFPRAAY